MKIEFHPQALSDIKPHEYAVRFLFGGLITALTGLIAKEFGPIVAGLFLAFPAIFPASATLVEKHERKKKERAGLHGERRGKEAASLDAAGAAAGCFGLLAFGAVIWIGLPRHNAALMLALAAIAWVGVSFCGWQVQKRL